MPNRLPAMTFRDPLKEGRNLDALKHHLGAERFDEILPHLNRYLPRAADADMALNNLERLFAQPAAREHLPGLLENKGRALEGAIQMVAVSQFFADTLALYPEALETLRTPPKRNPGTDDLTVQLTELVDASADDTATLRTFRKFRQLQMLRIGMNDILRERPLEEVTRELSRLADATMKVSLQTALKNVGKKYGLPTTPAGAPARITALGFGKLGGDELNYSSDIDLMFVYDEDGETTGKRLGAVPNSEFFSRTVTEVVRLLSSLTDRGFAYRVDLRLRPEGAHGPLAQTLANTLSYYDLRGRTWERQALIKLRPIAGDRALGKEVVAALEPFIYRKYFSFSEINEVKALKRQMEQRAAAAGVDDSDVKTGRGGIRDIEFAVQFLQLLNGGDLHAVRQRNTLLALDALEIAGCLTAQETYILADAYRFLRKTEHRLQLLFDWQTHRLPTDPDGLRKLALRMGYKPAQSAELGSRNEEKAVASTSSDPAIQLPNSALSPQRRSPLDEAPEPADAMRALLLEPLEMFLKDYHDKTRVDRAILDHLLHQTFTDTGDRAEPESDLVLDPAPDPAHMKAILGRYGFRDIPTAYENLNRLAQESVRLLSHRRCRHFLASIAPQLLKAVAETADPDEALNNLEQVTATLGAKAVLYELFSFNPPSLRLFVDLCANSPYLSAILMKNAGMEDELLDSLVLDQPRSAEELKAELVELLRGASDPEPILRSFQDNEFLRIGVRDLLGKAPIRATTAALSDVADTILNAVFDLVEPAVRAKFGIPSIESPPTAVGGSSRECRYTVLGLGKLGGREISYHSDLDLILVYEADGDTDSEQGTTNFHYFTELAQRVIRTMSNQGPLGRLYDVDMRLRPTGKSGSLVLPLAEFEKYFATGGAQVWERLAITRARVIRSEGEFAERVADRIRVAILDKPFNAQTITEIRAMRERLESTATPRNFKRVRGGLVDVEFAVQMLQLKNGKNDPSILKPNVWAALDALATAKVLRENEASALREGYSFLRNVEARLRIVTDRPLTEVPESDADLDKLARRLSLSAAAFRTEFAKHLARNRVVFDGIVERLKGETK
jgi:glutamate-ammonia-ligase adenylyltransferase